MGCSSSQGVVHENSQNYNNRQDESVRQGRPLVLSPNYRHGSHITQAEINRQREEFWNTRTTGNANMWAAIKGAAEALLSGDLPLASAILEASNVISANGSLELCYDERGHRYKVPQYCYSHPLELREVPSSSFNRASTNTSPVSDKPITLRVRINPGDYSLNIKMPDASHTIADLKGAITKKMQETYPDIIPPIEEQQRLMLLGKELKPHQRLADCSLDEKKVMQVFVRPLAVLNAKNK